MSEPCGLQSRVRHAAAEERWTSELRDHVATCDDCAAAASVAPWMDRFSKISDREHLLPDPALVWLKAQLMQGTVEASRATRPLNVAQLVAYLSVAGGWAAMLTWKWTALEAWLHSFTPAGLVASATHAESLSLSVFAPLAALATITLLLAMHTILAEE